MKFEVIKNYSEELQQMLKPYCLRLEIAGSIRRQMPECKDIDIVCIPDKYRLEEFLKLQGNKTGIRFEKNGSLYKRFKYKSNDIDLYIGNKNNFGWLYFIRTGSKEWNQRALIQLKKHNITSENCQLFRPFNETVPTPEEQDVFDLLECNFVEPQRRK